MKIFKKTMNLILIFMIMGIIYSFFFTTYEHFKVNKMINDFKDRANEEFESEELLHSNGLTYYRRYYEVPRETSAELNDKRNVFYDNEKQKLGNEGDIFVTRKSPFPTVPIIHQFISYYYGGHAAIVTYEDDQQYFIESTGFPDSGENIFDYIFQRGNKPHDLHLTVVKTSYNSWQTPSVSEHYYNYFYRDKYIGLRPVNHFSEMENGDEIYNKYINGAIEKANEKVEEERLYNFLFFLNMRYKYYCTDLMGRIYDESYQKYVNDDENYRSSGYAKKMNDDGFITSVNDLILSKDTFIHFYVEIVEEIIDGQTMIVENIYYLEDVK